MVRWMTALLFLTGCMTSPDKDENPSASTNGGQHVSTEEDEQPRNLPKPAAFDGTRAMGYLKAVCDIGPRMSGTAGMRAQQALLKKHFQDLGLTVAMQRFDAKQVSKAPVEMSNMIVSFAPERKRRVILCSHYDTRPIADQEEDPRKWRQTFLSANDGGSGVALLMELANHFKNLKIEVGVDLVFFDGEEYIWNNAREERGGDVYFFGSKHFAKVWVDNNRQPDYRGAILLDMIAGEGAEFPKDFYSRRNSRELCDEVWGLARRLKVRAFKNQDGEEVLDDHIALQKAGIQAVDIIDFKYPHWHRLTDTPANCSAESMRQVATVLSVWIQQVK